VPLVGNMQIKEEKLANIKAKKCIGRRKWGAGSKKVDEKGSLLQDN
jgi:hypothetical protein